MSPNHFQKLVYQSNLMIAFYSFRCPKSYSIDIRWGGLFHNKTHHTNLQVHISASDEKGEEYSNTGSAWLIAQTLYKTLKD